MFLKLFSCSIQLSIQFTCFMLINVKMPTMINTHLRDLKQETSLCVGIVVFMSS